MAQVKNCNLRESIREHRAQYDRELAELRYERDGLQARLAANDSRSEAC